MNINQLFCRQYHNNDSNKAKVIQSRKYPINKLSIELVKAIFNQLPMNILWLFSLSNSNVITFAASSLLFRDVLLTDLPIINEQQFLKIRFNHLHLFELNILNFCTVWRMYFEYLDKTRSFDILNQLARNPNKIEHFRFFVNVFELLEDANLTRIRNIAQLISSNSKYLKNTTIYFGCPDWSRLSGVLKTPHTKFHDSHTINYHHFNDSIDCFYQSFIEINLNNDFHFITFANSIIQKFTLETMVFSFINILKLIQRYLDEIVTADKLFNLKRLTISHKETRIVRRLDRLINLKYLNLSNGVIQRIENLDTQKNLKKLILRRNTIPKIENLDHLVNLEYLDLSRNWLIKKIENLDGLINLKNLELSHTKIVKIENLDALVNLTELDLSSNCINKVEGLSKLTKLNKLNLSQNYINEFPYFSNLIYLTRLNLVDQISKI
ncbi:L domain-like protein [Ascoidea rubescens DSM 1968]|uniref:L domain-like protein n=1 Tax=Ascoidea rubescens DSM 1968 TaxID=1344418 RepID=A0A1D2V8S5_9ASCO|nr:L domain-like protein [Ascoidea rubescens DSM 1968]XP_020046301.1 L domain-like protein [Ascoidea rubescens DSM 1968]XP_020046308.1 L domain-like protein [Ascoidea rubescens DSM 1968]ODV57843.1 L domain-like protein [Ascoidea rubescens DSM 1968]ODV59994.1 L domain-like protein [Ascoidea rubescens DSM 1968]ODV60001.1 L domain-like protein [Ascoidea rubescens DSM 1968]